MTWREWLGLSSETVPVIATSTVATWKALQAPDLNAPFANMRFVVLDTETTGLDVRRSELLSIGACVVEHGQLVIDHAFEVDLRPRTVSSDENVLIHEIGQHRQQGALDPVSALCRFLEFAGKPVFVAHHALFDATMIRNALKQHVGVKLDAQWLDVGVLLPALHRQVVTGPVELDALTQRYGASCHIRHDALADAFATAQLWLVALQQAKSQGLTTIDHLLRLQKSAIERAAGEHRSSSGA